MFKTKNSIFLLVIFGFILSPYVNANNAENIVATKKTSKTIAGLIPAGWKIIKQTKYADLNHDGKQDIVINIAEKTANFEKDEMVIRLLVLLGKEDGFILDYDIHANLGTTPNVWSHANGMERFAISMMPKDKRNALYIRVLTSLDNNRSESSHAYTFAYREDQLIAIGYTKNSMMFDYSSRYGRQDATLEYDFLQKTLKTHDSFNTNVYACSFSASEAEQKNCPEPIDKTEKLSIPASFVPEISHFVNFAPVDWQKSFGVKPIK